MTRRQDGEIDMKLYLLAVSFALMFFMGSLVLVKHLSARSARHTEIGFHDYNYLDTFSKAYPDVAAYFIAAMKDGKVSEAEFDMIKPVIEQHLFAQDAIKLLELKNKWSWRAGRSTKVADAPRN